MALETYKLIDDGTGICGKVTIIDPQGNDITKQVKSYTVTRTVGEPTKIVLELIAYADLDVTALDSDDLDVTALDSDVRVFQVGA